MKKIVVIEAGDDYVDRLEALEADVTTVERAMKVVAGQGYKVMTDAEGGCNEHVITREDEYFAVTVFPD